jgi:uncharacterized alpha/beta hydrolase family protein
MDDLSEHLRKQGYQVFNVAYSSTEQTVAENAADLDRVISSLEGIEEIDFVAHSLGNLVLRRYLADQTDATKGKSPDPRIKRIVMLAPPNNGAQLASRFAGSSVVQFCWGAAGREIADWDKLKVQLVVPSCEFGILAGGREVKHSDNPLIEGDDDFVVSVEETKLPGARDFQILPVWHHKMNENEKAFEYTTRFLATGCFIDQRSRHPLPRTEEAMRRDEVAK